MVGASTLGIAASQIAMWNAMVATTALSMATGVAGSIMQSRNAAAQAKAQSATAQQQANIQRQNQQLAEQQASAQRRQGYENMLNTRRKAASLVGSQRATAGASGVAVDYGSFADVGDETATQAELDAINAYNKGIDQGYNSEISAWNYGQQADAQASAYNRQASQASMAGGLGALQAGIGGIADGVSTWGKFYTPTPGQYTYDPALGSYVRGGKTWTH